ncbi:phosphatidylethanolamine-binding protein [Cokeromyces recurvatus]|uniref:phosphatidylethanolamine-binding protein n=1 Tax=Cokeromyces recurvatus TaxID=90255 RepID=UPI00221F2D9F|nr:phosphatidylethanolamine-binding protein [Cokeromyces recurvatus]KAI7907827.1 phosphatidylethanolamine-binding protein [Cokeromyces recurvatus]
MFSTVGKRSFQIVRCISKYNNIRQASTKTSGHTAYEEALKLIALDKKERLNMLERLEKEITRAAKTATPAQLKALDALKFDLQVKSELNEPEVQKKFKLGDIDMLKPVYRYMRQREFEKVSKSKLLERLSQMNVIPDLLPTGLNPTIDVAVKLLPDGQQVEPGVFLKPEQSVQCPEIEITNFHVEQRLYTLMLVDPDSPDVENKTYQQYCHWLLSNVPLSTTSTIIKGGDSILDYIPPHPQKGTKYHRYTLIVCEQPNEGQEKVDIKVNSRDHFDVKGLVQSYALKTTGATFFRQVWDEQVSKIYNEILKQNEPIYGKPPKVERYIQRTVYY